MHPSLNSSAIFSNGIQTISPSCELTHWINRSCIRITCPFPETCGWIETGKMNSSYSSYANSNCSFQHLYTLSTSTYPCEPALPGLGCNGGQSSTFQFAGISTTPEAFSVLIGFIHVSAFRLKSVSTHVV